MIVVTDMVGTITTGAPVPNVASWIRQHQSAWRARRLMATLLVPYLLTKLRLLDSQRFGQWSMQKALLAVQDPDEEVLAQMTDWVFENEVWPKRRQDVLARLAEHRSADARIYIVSTAWNPLVSRFAEKIGAEPLGSPVAIEDGYIRVVGETVGGEGKMRAIHSRIGDESVDYGYGDTWADVPMLSLAENPVAVYPDSRLQSYALQNGWDIIEDMQEG